MIGKNGVSLLIGHNGVQDKTALNPANETVARGIYDATTLSTVDAELATANIKNGITIFGFAGSADVHDISDATAIEAEVLSPETFYAASGGIRTGTMPTVALAEGENAYPAGYHAGAASLTAVDGELVTGSIKFGVTIFGVAGHTNVRDSSDANATATRVRSGYTFYAGGGARKTGTLATVAITAANDNYPAGYHAGNAGGLDAIDTDLTGANIKYGKTIFGKVGTFVGGPPVYDDEDKVKSSEAATELDCPSQETASVGAGSEGAMLSRTLTCAQATIIFAFAYGWLRAPMAGSAFVVRLYIDGVLIDSAAEITNAAGVKSWIVQGYRSVSSGARTIEVKGYNSGGSSGLIRFLGGLGAGCPKL